jgi:hypothetical protein
VREGGERPGGGTAPCERRPGGTRLVLAGQPSPQRGQVELARVNDTEPGGVLKQRLNVTTVSTDGVPGQAALGAKVAAECLKPRRQPRWERGAGPFRACR